MGIEEGTFWDEHWVLYGNQFDNKFHILKKKTTLRYHLTPVIVAKMNKSGDYWCWKEKRELSCTVGGNANWCSFSGKLWRFLKKLKIELPYDPAIALLEIYPRDTGVLMHRGPCTPMFITALSIIAKLCKESKCPSTDERIKKMWFIYTMEYYLVMRKNEIWPFAATWMELEGIMLGEISQTEKDRCHMFSFIWGIWET